MEPAAQANGVHVVLLFSIIWSEQPYAQSDVTEADATRGERSPSARCTLTSEKSSTYTVVKKKERVFLQDAI